LSSILAFPLYPKDYDEYQQYEDDYQYEGDNYDTITLLLGYSAKTIERVAKGNICYLGQFKYKTIYSL
jgi:hypothetical protein